MSDLRTRLTPIGEPTEVDIAAAEQGYLRYLTGVSVIYDPAATEALHRVDLKGSLSPEQLDTIAVYGEDLIYRGLKQVIRYCAGSGHADATPAIDLAEEQGILLPRMTGVANSVNHKHMDRLAKLCPALPLAFLAPMNDPTVYKYFRHSNHHRVATLRLIDPLQPAPMFGDLFVGRTINRRNLSTSS